LLKLDGSFPVFGRVRERLVPAKSKVGFQLTAGFHMVSAEGGYVSSGASGMKFQQIARPGPTN
jgi:hypothetical protein